MDPFVVMARKKEDSEFEDDITGLLEEWSRGDQGAPEKLMPLVYDELRHVAERVFSRERVDHTLEPAALVNEIFLEFVKRRQLSLKNRSHLYGVAAQMMRRVLVNHARKRNADRRGGDVRVLSLDVATSVSKTREVDLIALDDALKDLADFDSEGSRVVEMRFFGGMTYPEIARFLDVPEIRVRRNWIAAKTWLYRQLNST